MTVQAVISKILVANRGEIACRVFRTAREMGIATVAVFSDADDGAPHMREADEAVRLSGSLATDTYLRADLILAAARSTGADAIHPGYGFLSENAAFARSCTAAGLTFIGPSADVIDAMGSKTHAKALMHEAGVPVLPGFPVLASTTDDELIQAARAISYPVLVKAVFGGGGRGMRVARTQFELVEAVAIAQREALAAFGDGSVFIERYVDAPRHIEIQIFADQHGNVVSLFERECSIQRRHQKVIEEAPSTVVDDSRRTLLGAAAVAAAKSIGYVGAGTVEFVMDADGAFYFLEVNTRLQVEHPVTEMVTGLDLVRLQIEVAQGGRLPVRVTNASITGHAIEARLYAEDVAGGFVPTSGAVHRLTIPLSPGIRVDSGYTSGSMVSSFYDAMIAKVIASASTRTEAIARLADTLARAEIHGVVTNRDLLVNTLRHPEFAAGLTDTAFFDRNDHVAMAVAAQADIAGSAVDQIHAIACALAPSDTDNPQPRGVPRGWRNVGPSRVVRSFRSGVDQIDVVVERHRGDLSVGVNGESSIGLTMIDVSVSSIEFELLGRRHRVRLHRVEGAGGTHVYADSSIGHSTFWVEERFAAPEPVAAAGSLVSPMPGRVVAVHVANGSVVTTGQVVVAIEAMKMEHAIRAPIDGIVADVRVVVGDQVDSGAVLVVVETDVTSTTENN